MRGDWIGEILYSSQLSSTVAIFISLYNSACYRFYVYWHNDCFHTRPNRIATTSKVGFYSGQQSATRGESSTGKIKNQHRRQGEGGNCRKRVQEHPVTANLQVRRFYLVRPATRRKSRHPSPVRLLPIFCPHDVR